MKLTPIAHYLLLRKALRYYDGPVGPYWGSIRYYYALRRVLRHWLPCNHETD